jgi:polyhydroxybutyrate depolymerase
MRPLLRLLRACLLVLLGLVALAGGLFGYFLHSPDPEPPPPPGTVARGTVAIGGLERTYRTYVPRALSKNAPLVIVMHGSGESGAEARIETGYGFERLAEAHGFAVAYPDAYTFDWNDCSRVGDYRANGTEVDDVGFLDAMVDKVAAELGSDRERVYATGVSAGGSMAMRLALEAPLRYRAVAAVSANVPTAANFKCQPAAQSTSLLIMNGTEDPLVPFAGGEINLLGWFYKGGDVRSSRDSAQYFADRIGPAAQPTTTSTSVSGGFRVERLLWRNDAGPEVELVAIHGGGHGMPQPYWRRPRLLGPSPMQPDGPALAWAFFERQGR